MKNIIVCIKQVPETENVKINEETNTLIRDGVQSILNPYDLHAIEAALRLKEVHTECRIIAVTMGPPQATDVLKEAISMGVDEVILLSDRAFAGADVWATAYTLSQAIQQIDQVDLILCGKQAVDGDTGQVGPGIAEFLNIPHVSCVSEIKSECGKLLVKRVTEYGCEWIESNLPLLLTVTKELNEPRYPSLKGKMKAKTAQILTWNAQDIKADPLKIGLAGSPTRVAKIFTPPEIEQSTEIFKGDCDSCVQQLADRIKSLL